VAHVPKLAGYIANYAHADRVDFDYVAMVAVVCAAQWATRVQLWALGQPARYMVKRRLPHDRRSAETMTETLWRRLLVEIERDKRLRYLPKVSALLLHGKDVVLDLHDGPGCCLHVATERFDELQRCWQEHGLPADIYVPEPPHNITTTVATGGPPS
jgi:hypothetical protein